MKTLALRAARSLKARLSAFLRRSDPPEIEATSVALDMARAVQAAKMLGLAGPQFDAAMAAAGGFATWFAIRRQSRRQFMELALAHASEVVAICPEQMSQALRIAKRLRRHEFNFLGSGPFVPADPLRAHRNDFQPINWFLDPVRNLSFPHNVPYKSWDLFAMRPGNADIKYPWELSRCQHFLGLGQAYVFSRDPVYAHELISQAEDYIEANPIGLGINYTCTMDVALGAANWCFALSLIKPCEAVSLERFEAVYRHLHNAARFILQNLENNYEVTSNHFLSNVAGLHVLAAEFSDLPQATAWDNFAREAMEREITVQILPDGADYESSVPYHRLVTELFLGSCRLADIQSKPLSAAYRATLEKMLIFHEAVLRPDGRMPVNGDADDGRLLIATGYGEWDPADGLHLLAPAARMFERPEWVTGTSAEKWEAFWWGFEPQSNKQPIAAIHARTLLFADAGLAVSKDASKGAYLLVTNGIVGTKGFGNHKHNDLLSFEYHDMGVALIVDPGSYVYTSDFSLRNEFRATAAHNTVMIDGVQQNEFKADWLFRMFQKARPAHAVFAALPDGMIYEGSHDGYETQLPEGVRHVRRFEHNRVSGQLQIVDKLNGVGSHKAVWHFHFADGILAELGSTGCILRSRERNWRLVWSDTTLRPVLLDGSVSPSYGVKRPSMMLRLERTLYLATPAVFEFNLKRFGQQTA